MRDGTRLADCLQIKRTVKLITEQRNMYDHLRTLFITPRRGTAMLHSSYADF